ncbi:hypothetical protein PPERSA_09359 [Pseudocohnilembus persalinus]|uniref:Uncharacterized protein n=1 Tax=Pseudocohnilembus persalinus TaxID=266149 RepID=A0A0V0QXP9_PSEPJ|nr:hypothetical protein PPERSA_09359 [Pseudocohnilembus persalinus]|eukprot:KRX07145.1 hypothetical protein PPERSA_09359 [Pseudocohnilembus persalinus]
MYETKQLQDNRLDTFNKIDFFQSDNTKTNQHKSEYFQERQKIKNFQKLAYHEKCSIEHKLNNLPEKGLSKEYSPQKKYQQFQRRIRNYLSSLNMSQRQKELSIKDIEDWLKISQKQKNNISTSKQFANDVVFIENYMKDLLVKKEIQQKIQFEQDQKKKELMQNFNDEVIEKQQNSIKQQEDQDKYKKKIIKLQNIQENAQDEAKLSNNNKENNSQENYEQQKKYNIQGLDTNFLDDQNKNQSQMSDSQKKIYEKTKKQFLKEFQKIKNYSLNQSDKKKQSILFLDQKQQTQAQENHLNSENEIFLNSSQNLSKGCSPINHSIRPKSQQNKTSLKIFQSRNIHTQQVAKRLGDFQIMQQEQQKIDEQYQNLKKQKYVKNQTPQNNQSLQNQDLQTSDIGINQAQTQNSLNFTRSVNNFNAQNQFSHKNLHTPNFLSSNQESKIQQISSFSNQKSQRFKRIYGDLQVINIQKGNYSRKQSLSQTQVNQNQQTQSPLQKNKNMYYTSYSSSKKINISKTVKRLSQTKHSQTAQFFYQHNKQSVQNQQDMLKKQINNQNKNKNKNSIIRLQRSTTDHFLFENKKSQIELNKMNETISNSKIVNEQNKIEQLLSDYKTQQELQENINGVKKQSKRKNHQKSKQKDLQKLSHQVNNDKKYKKNKFLNDELYDGYIQSNNYDIMEDRALKAREEKQRQQQNKYMQIENNLKEQQKEKIKDNKNSQAQFKNSVISKSEVIPSQQEQSLQQEIQKLKDEKDKIQNSKKLLQEFKKIINLDQKEELELKQFKNNCEKMITKRQNQKIFENQNSVTFQLQQQFSQQLQKERDEFKGTELDEINAFKKQLKQKEKFQNEMLQQVKKKEMQGQLKRIEEQYNLKSVKRKISQDYELNSSYESQEQNYSNIKRQSYLKKFSNETNEIEENNMLSNNDKSMEILDQNLKQNQSQENISQIQQEEDEVEKEENQKNIEQNEEKQYKDFQFQISQVEIQKQDLKKEK